MAEGLLRRWLMRRPDFGCGRNRSSPENSPSAEAHKIALNSSMAMFQLLLGHPNHVGLHIVELVNETAYSKSYLASIPIIGELQ